jgi:dTDP-4-dehydrorhamnose 3,5-epimerase
MDIRPTTIHGVHLARPIVHRDHRGSFNRTFDADSFAAAGLPTDWPQHNQSVSHRGVLRGMHVRTGTGEGKVVRVAHGAVEDVVVDVRPTSPTFLVAERFRLDDTDNRALVLPAGVAHGYQVVSDVAVVAYLHTERYDPAAEGAFRWDDPELAIEWPITPVVVSERDATSPSLAEFLRTLG